MTGPFFFRNYVCFQDNSQWTVKGQPDLLQAGENWKSGHPRFLRHACHYTRCSCILFPSPKLIRNDPTTVGRCAHSRTPWQGSYQLTLNRHFSWKHPFSGHITLYFTAFLLIILWTWYLSLSCKKKLGTIIRESDNEEKFIKASSLVEIYSKQSLENVSIFSAFK